MLTNIPSLIMFKRLKMIFVIVKPTVAPKIYPRCALFVDFINFLSACVYICHLVKKK